MHGQANIGESILNFGAFVKTEATDEFVAQATAAEGFFERARLKIGAILDGAGLIGIVAEQFLQFFGDKFPLALPVTPSELPQISSGPPLAPTIFAHAA